MTRDMALVREILLKVERDDQGGLPDEVLRIDGYDDQIVGRHAQLMHEAGLLHAHIIETDRGVVRAMVFRLTWAGHEFLDAARHESIWSKTVTRLKSEAVAVPFEVMKTVLIAELKSRLKIQD